MFADAFSLELTKIVIPTYKFHGESALLECQYELRNSNRNYHNRYNNNKDYGYRSIHSSISDDNNGIDHLHNGGFSSGTSSDEEETLYSVKWYKGMRRTKSTVSFGLNLLDFHLFATFR